MKKIEILAPVGSVDALKAAVRCGADAVYLGQKNFSARKNSQNFEEDELCAAVSYAHRCGVKVHQALNILVFDHELTDLKRCISSACRAGVDALIVQDWGVAAIVRVLAPHIKLHASTQMAIYSLAGVQMAEKMGFSRVVLARELSQKEISHIREHTNIELEVFVHGAYCMCISGQCYMSAAFGGKSGNRGQCAQPCRLPFTVSGKGENVLSLKDLCLVERMPLLQKMGIDSVKIEGRMKRPEYVAAAVTACRQARSGEKPDMETLQSVFSRSGFTAGYFDGRIDADMFGYRKKEDVVSANDVFKSLSQLYHKQTPLIPIEMNLSVKKDQPILLEITDPDGHLVSIRGEMPTAAFQIAITTETAQKFLSKLGGTPYFLKNFFADIEDHLSLSGASLNAIRRQAIEQLDRLREEVMPFSESDELPTTENVTFQAAPVYWGKFSSFSQIPWEQELSLDRILLPLDEVERHSEELLPYFHKIILVPPRFSFQREPDVQKTLLRLAALGYDKLYCDNIAHLTLGKNAKMELIGGAYLNFTNSYSLMEAKTLGISSAVISIEEKLVYGNHLQAPFPIGVLGYGYLPLMSIRNCPVKAQIGCKACGQKGFLTDRKNWHFPVRCDKENSFIYNTLPLSISDRQVEFTRYQYILLDFTIETQEQTRAIIEDFVEFQKQNQEVTRGLYYRGVE